MCRSAFVPSPPPPTPSRTSIANNCGRKRLESNTGGNRRPAAKYPQETLVSMKGNYNGQHQILRAYRVPFDVQSSADMRRMMGVVRPPLTLPITAGGGITDFKRRWQKTNVRCLRIRTGVRECFALFHPPVATGIWNKHCRITRCQNHRPDAFRLLDVRCIGFGRRRFQCKPVDHI